MVKDCKNTKFLILGLGLYFFVTPVNALTKLQPGINFESNRLCPIASDIALIPFSNQKLENGTYKAYYFNYGLFNSTHVRIKVKDELMWVMINSCGSISYSEWINDKFKQKKKLEDTKKQVEDSFRYLQKSGDYLSELIRSEKNVNYWSKRVDNLTSQKVGLENSIKLARKSSNLKLVRELSNQLVTVTEQLSEAKQQLLKAQRNLKRFRTIVNVVENFAMTVKKRRIIRK